MDGGNQPRKHEGNLAHGVEEQTPDSAKLWGRLTDSLAVRPNRERGCNRRATAYPCTTGLRNSPTPSISTSTSSPGLRNTGGLRAAPTPGGVPVKIRSPGSSVITCERNWISCGTLKMNSRVLLSCITWPLSRSLIGSAWWSGDSWAVTRSGTGGAKVSNGWLV